jgi:Putative porin
MFDQVKRGRRRALAAATVLVVANVVATPARGAEETNAPAPVDAAARAAQDGAAGSQQAASTGAPPAAPEGVKRVVYVPESVKAELREEIKKEVLDQAKRENWAAPNAFPDWLRRFHFKGDVRGRWERSIFGAANDNTGGFPDFNAINTGKPVNVNLNLIDVANDRFLNVDQNRTRPRLRARFGADVDVGQGFTAGLRLASGDGNTPVSTNQTLGGSPGDFSKYQFWLDRAFLRYVAPGGVIGAEMGRFENPFFSTDMLWDEDVNLDGLAVLLKVPIGHGVKPFATAGAFPVFTSAFNFPPERSDKFKSLDKWLYAAQVGADWKVDDSLSVKLAGAFYYFDKIEGRFSGPCDTNLKDIFCDTDESRPAFAQKGNTYMPLRTPSPDALAAEAADPNNTPRYQFFGLAARFRELAATARLDYRVAPPLSLGLEGEYVRNVGFSKKQISPDFVAINNRGPTSDPLALGPYQGGDTGYVGRLTLGSPTQNGRWDWNVSLAYRRVESDAVVDAFTDSDFGLGGTNLKGYVLGAGLGLADGVWTSARWMSADAIVGPTFRVDVLQIDVAARF